MKKALLFASLALAAAGTSVAQNYPKPIERVIPWTIIAGSELKAADTELGGYETGGIADLIDRNPLTYWNSNPAECDANNASHHHWFLIDRGLTAKDAPFTRMSLRQRIIQTGTNPDESAEWEGAVDRANVYVTDEFIGLVGTGATADSQNYDDELLAEFLETQPNPTLEISLKIYDQNPQFFDFAEPQTGRYILVVITHTVNPNGDQTTNDAKACLAELDLYGTETITGANFEGNYALTGTNPENTASSTNRTRYIEFSNAGIDQWRSTPFLQSTAEYDPYTDTLNWLEWQKTWFDITPIFTFRTGIGQSFELRPSAVGEGFKALYIDWENDGFADNEAVAKTDASGALNAIMTVAIPADKTAGTYRARYIADTQEITSAEPSTSISEGGILVDFMIELGNQVTFTVNMKFEGELIKSEQKTWYAGAPFSIDSPAFFDVPVVHIAPAEGSLEVDMTRLNLPFAYTKELNEADLKWQAIHMHSMYVNEKHTLEYNAEDDKVYMRAYPANVDTEGFPDSMLWAIVGDIKNGFRIYNKAAGLTKNLYNPDSPVNDSEVTLSESERIWEPVITNAGNSYKFCGFKQKGDASGRCINHRNIGNVLRHWSAQEGSTCWFTAAATPLLNEVAEYTFDYEGATEPLVGEYYYTGDVVPDPTDLVSRATANPYDYANLQELKDLIDDYEANKSLIPMTCNKWYRLISANTSAPAVLGSYMYTQATTTAINAKKYAEGESYKTDYHNIFYAEQVEGQTDRFYLYSQGRYIQQTVADNNTGGKAYVQTEDKSLAGQWEAQSRVGVANVGDVALVGPATYSLKDHTVDQVRSMLNVVGTSISSWGPWTGGVLFYIAAADDIEVNLTETHDGDFVGFGYFPFDVQVKDASKLYYMFPGTDDNDKPIIDYREVATVPAHTAFMIRNDEYNVANLAITYPDAAEQALYYDTPDAAATANVLEGSLRPTTVAAGEYDLCHATDGKLTFVKAEGDTQVGGNSIYMPAANLPETHTALDQLALKDSDNTTAIRDVVAEPQTAAKTSGIFDLQGRRLAAPVKGINIINGKKVMVK